MNYNVIVSFFKLIEASIQLHFAVGDEKVKWALEKQRLEKIILEHQED